VKKIRSPSSVAPRIWIRRVKYSAPCTCGTTRFPAVHGAISLRQEPIAHPYRLPVRCRYVTRRRFNRGAVPGVPACPTG
jgi:hypothetical protein